MYIIAVYDINVKRVNKVRKVFDKYLNRFQYSVYEGELGQSDYKRIQSEVKAIIEEDEDHVAFFVMTTDKYLKKVEFGSPKNESGFI